MKTLRSRTLRMASIVAGSVATALLCAPTAHAAGDQKALVDQYSSLSGALLGFYADQSQETLAQYLARQQVTLAPTTIGDPVAERLESMPSTGGPTGTPTESGYGSLDGAPQAPSASSPVEPTGGAGGVLSAPQAAALGLDAKSVNAATVTDLNKQLAAAGLTVNTSGFKSLDALAAKVAATSSTPDGAVTLAGARWIQQLSTLHTPALGKPSATRPSAPGIPKDALPYGLLLNKSLTTMITDHPDMFADAKKSGLGSTAMSNAWGASMLKAYKASSADFASVLPSPCTGGMLAVMASGDPASAAKATGGKCSTSCVTGGMYLNSQSKALFDPARASIIANPTAQVWNGATYGAFQGWAKGLAMSQNPDLNSSLTKTLGGANNTTGCGAAAKATQTSLGKTLPGVFAALR